MGTRFGGAILAGTAGVAYAIIPMTWPHPTDFQLHAIWTVLALLFLVGIALILWPKRARRDETPEGEQMTGIDMRGSTGGLIHDIEIKGFDTGVDMSGSKGGTVSKTRVTRDELKKR
jgi:membrane protein implicated in regulation of membrane protease activity